MSTSASHDHLLSLACDVLHAHCTVLLLADGDTFMATAAACVTAPAPVAAEIIPGKGLAGIVLRNKEPLVVNTFDPQTQFIGYYEEAHEVDITNFMAVPLPNGRGALCVDRTDGEPFTDAEESVLSRFALLVVGQNEAAAQEAGDPDDSQRYLEAFEQIQRLRNKGVPWREYVASFLSLTAKSTLFDYVALIMRPEDAPSYTIEGESTALLLGEGTEVSLPVDSVGLVSWVLRDGGLLPVFSDGMEGSTALPLFGKLEQMPVFKCNVCLPISFGRSVYGVIVMAGLAPRSLPENLRTFASMCAAEVGIHISTLDMKRKLQNHMRAKARSSAHTGGED